MSKCEHGLTTKECYVCMSPKYGENDTKQECVSKPQGEEHMSIEAMKQALEALDRCGSENYSLEREAIESLRQAIEQAEKQEPYGWVSQHTVKGPYEWQFNKELSGVYRDNAISILPVYTTPQQREWVGLTDEEIALVCGECAASAYRHDDISYARAIEAKLKEKNS